MPCTVPDCPQQGGLNGQVKDSVGSGLFLLPHTHTHIYKVGIQTESYQKTGVESIPDKSCTLTVSHTTANALQWYRDVTLKY